MSAVEPGTLSRDRVVFATLGGGAGLAAWLLVDVLGEVVDNQRLQLFLVMLAGVFFAALLGMIGPLRPLQALPRAAALALVVAGLMVWAGLRFDDLEPFLQQPYPVLAAIGLTSIAVPFLIASGLPGSRWHDYPTLFGQAWSIVVRYGAAWLFVGVVWLLVMLSDALFGLVGLRVIEDLLDLPPVPYLVTGVALGLALAVVEEMADYLSPYMVLRLLRLLLPVVLVVVAVFLAVLPFRGLSGLFGDYSVAAILLAIALGAATLVTTALDQADAEAADTPVMRYGAQATALLIPVLAGLAAYAIWLRVGQHGWTPQRLAGAVAALVMLGYGGLYAAAVLRGAGWMERIRRANVTMALAVMALAALWLTPVLNAEAISARSQLARFEAGTTPVDELGVWEMREDWGRPGTAALAELRGMAGAGGQEALRLRLAQLDAAEWQADFLAAGESGDARALLEELRPVLPVRPTGNEAQLDAIVKAAQPTELRTWIDGCNRKTATGKSGCVLVVGDFLLHEAGPEAMLFYRSGADGFYSEAFSMTADGVMRRLITTQIGGGAALSEMDADEVLELLAAGQFSVAPAAINALSVGDRQIMMNP